MVLCECLSLEVISQVQVRGLATIRLGSCGNAAVRIGGLCRRRSVIHRGAGTLQRPSHSCADGAN
jgi:hypothetical protein